MGGHSPTMDSKQNKSKNRNQPTVNPSLYDLEEQKHKSGKNLDFNGTSYLIYPEGEEKFEVSKNDQEFEDELDHLINTYKKVKIKVKKIGWKIRSQMGQKY